ncbi:30S ribosomal protein S5 [Candidatus Woesearchaeota archaeon]|nr:30S ribosomal protein S5 [Candidatus Woesearchaeota archaeon]
MQDNKTEKTPDFANWKPKTELGKKVKDREITSIDEILDQTMRILEPEITDSLLTLENDLMLIGQSKGKFGGGARRVFRQTQKKTMEGNKPKFSTIAVVGDRNGHVGVGLGKAKETVPAREKAMRRAKINIFKIRRGCGSWQCGCQTPHSIPYAVTGKCGSVEIKLMPAPKGKGIICQKDIAKIIELAGIKDIWAKTRGQTKNRVNFVYACEDALRQLAKVKIRHDDIDKLAIVEGEKKRDAAEASEASETAPTQPEGEQ